MNKNKTEASDIMIVRLMSILSNKLHLNKLEFKKLATATLKTDEQIDAADSISFIKSLTQALSLQVIIQLAIR